jgi:hypothetical protein
MTYYCIPPEDGLRPETLVTVMTEEEEEEDCCIDGIIVKLVT